MYFLGLHTPDISNRDLNESILFNFGFESELNMNRSVAKLTGFAKTQISPSVRSV